MSDERDLRHDQLPPYTFQLEGTNLTHDPDARCRHCDSAADLIEDDGPVVCRNCVQVLVEIAAKPEGVKPSILDELQARHSEVVALMRLANGIHVWHWIAGWPGIEPRSS